MNWLAMAMKIVSHLPVERLFNKPKESGKALERLTQALAPSTREPLGIIDQASVVKESPPITHNKSKEVKMSLVSIEETIAYQRREIGKELLLLEKHFQQRCKIGGKACDCCQKHPMAIEALSQEALGLSSDEIFDEIAQWSKEIAPITTEEASASGAFDKQYPEMAIKARGLRKRLMGGAPLLDPALKARVDEKVENILRQTLE